VEDINAAAPTATVAEQRLAAIRPLIARAARTARRVYGYNSSAGGCYELPATPQPQPHDGPSKARRGKGRGAKPGDDSRRVPAAWDRICVEGDREWTKLPPVIAAGRKRKSKGKGKGGGRRKGGGGDAVVNVAEKAGKTKRAAGT